MSAEPIAVTGATGFLGGRVARALLATGLEVRAFGRDLDAGLALRSLGADFRPVDLRDAPAVRTACRGVEAVIHCGALSSAWGRRRDFFETNVAGTQNVVEACLAAGVPRLVHISSPSVVSRFAHQLDLDESAPFPHAPVSVYSETKALAELGIRHAIANRELRAVILRPKAIYGPGDRALLPRLERALAGGDLPRIGEGRTLTNITHVDDAVRAVLGALRSDAALGRTYFVTGPDSVDLWELADAIADARGYRRPRRPMPVARAMRAAAAMELAWRALHLTGEPPFTRYTIGIFAYSQTYDIRAARRDLGYAPRIGWREGVAALLADPPRNVEAPGGTPRIVPATAPRPTPVAVMRSGSTRARERFIGSGPSLRRIEVPALFALIDHPSRGPVLFDTGYHPAFAAATARLPYSLYRALTPVEIDPGATAGARLVSRGVPKESVRWIVLSHFDPDHCGGLVDFPNARVMCTREAWAAVAGRTGIAALRARFLPDLLPPDLTARLDILPPFDDPPVGPFERSHDVFRDGAIRLVELPGHAPGMVGAFVRGTDGRDLFLCADAVWSRPQIEPGSSRRTVHRLVASDAKRQDATYEALSRLEAENESIRFVPSHCPAAWRELDDEKEQTR